MVNQETVINDIPASAHIRSKPIFEKVDVYQSFWIFFIGSVMGSFVETAWFLIYYGRFVCRSSLLFLPFSAVYGLGALVLFLGLRKIEKTKVLHIFVYGAVTCTTVEYLCSLFQEKSVGSVSWDYSDKLFNIDGRVCLDLTFAWGLLAVVWVLVVQPFFEMIIMKIPPRAYKPLTCGIAVFLIINVIISVVAIARWGVRLDGIPPADNFAVVIDRLFPDDFMRIIYPGMRW